jgi:hypothetical protein
MLASVERVLDDEEHVDERGVCWAATRRPKVPLLFLGRHQYDVMITDRRILLFSRRRWRRLRPDDVAMAKRFTALTLDATHDRVVLLQQLVRTDTGARLVLEWRRRHRDVGRKLAAALSGAELPTAAA